MPRRFPLVFVLLIATATAVAAPVPKESGAAMLKRVFGTAADPDSKVTCVPVGKGGLRITVPAGLDREEKLDAATKPLVAREIEGSFILEARLTFKFDPKARPEKKGDGATVTAGVVFRDGDGRSAEATFTCFKDEDDWRINPLFDANEHRQSLSEEKLKCDGKPIYLRLIHFDECFLTEFSRDGEKWTEFGNNPVKGFGKKVRFGPVAWQSTNADCVVEIDEYEIIPMKKVDEGFEIVKE